MREIDYRLETVEDLFLGRRSTTYDVTTIESICLQLRKVLEHVAFSSLILHKREYEEIRNDIKRDWHATRILKKVQDINPYYYPIPLNDPEHGDLVYMKSGYLTKKQFTKLYDECGAILHARNPFTRRSKPMPFYKRVPDHLSRIRNLLSRHKITFQGSAKVVFVQVPFNSEEPIQVSYGRNQHET
jgi:hypothetical protein